MAKRILAWFIIAVCLTTAFSFITVNLGSLIIRVPGVAVDILSNSPNGEPYSLQKVTDEIASDVATVFGVGAAATIGKLASNGGQLKRSECHSTLEKGIYMIQAGLRVLNDNYPQIPFDTANGYQLKNQFAIYQDESIPKLTSSVGDVFIIFYSPVKYKDFNVDPFPYQASWAWFDNYAYQWRLYQTTATGNNFACRFDLCTFDSNGNTTQRVQKNSMKYQIPFGEPQVISSWDWNKDSCKVKVYCTNPNGQFYIKVNNSLILVEHEYIIDSFRNGDIYNLGIHFRDET